MRVGLGCDMCFFWIDCDVDCKHITGKIYGARCHILKCVGLTFERGFDRVTHYQVDWKEPHTVEQCRRCYLFSYFPYAQC